ncbi:hypothetical protein IWW34DRAFT_826868 [Fusarium oxysporum f. sp. albedinis]|nr:hypothetical protein IWW34DRAFT_826868 [Fusarium oxysporum f. sp. albedinis]
MPYTNVDLQNLTSKDVEYFYYHLFLPDKLPDRDNNCSKDERLLMSFVHRSLESFITKTNPEAGAAIKAYSFMIGRLQKSKNAHGFLSVGGVQNVLQQLSLKGAALKHDLTQILTHRAIAPSALFHMPAQNSGAFISELPYGYNIQWQSILNQLAMPRIDFNKMETAIFLLQMSLQAGPRSLAATRYTHTRLSDHEFGRVMLKNLAKGVSRIRENWESYTALCSLTLLASRVLSQVPSDLVSPFIDLIDECRAVAYRWGVASQRFPLARLPREYERHDNYKRLFGGLVLEGMPSNMPGMRFCTAQQFQGNTVYFGTQDQDLLIRLEAIGSYVDLIPLRTLRELLPHSFVDEYAHWYHVSTGIVEFSPLKDPWARNSSNWFLSRSDEVWTLRQVRMLIVPEGRVHIQRLGGQATAAVAYVHALTSFCLPDPFLGQTGTEEAIRLLGSASVRAPGPLSTTEHGRLQSIASLSPVRVFYPEHERVMQQVSWSSDLGFLAQDDRFYTITKGIIDRSAEVGFLYPDTDRPGELSQNTIKLVKRAILRKARQCVSGYGAEDFFVQHDVIYQSRDNGSSDRAARAAEMAFRAYRGHASLLEPVAAGLSNHLYTLLSHEAIASPRTIPPEDDLLYDSKWLSSPATFLSAYWCQLHQAFQSNQSWLSKFKLMVWIATVTYSSKYDQQVTQALLSIALSSSISAAPLPSQSSYNLFKGYEVSKTRLGSIADSAAISFDRTPVSHLVPRPHKQAHQIMNRRRQEYTNKKYHAVRLFESELSLQWPCEHPQAPSDRNVASYIDTRKAMRSVVGEWRNWHDNREFRGYLVKLIKRIEELLVDRGMANGSFTQPAIQPTSQSLGLISVDNLFRHSQGPATPTQNSLIRDLLRGRSISFRAITKLIPLLDFLDDKAELVFKRRYLGELRQSLASLKDHMSCGLAQDDASALLIVFQEHLVQCETNVRSIYEALLDAVNQIQQDVPAAIQQAFQDTRCRPRAKRLVSFCKDEAVLIRELENSGHEGWRVHEYPEWLLLECESEIMIRQVQQQIARQMMHPSDGENISLQLNMGEAKSSVIVPIVVSAQGNGSRLVRVIVAKPQSKQMQQMLIYKLAGMLDRPVYQLPFSRDIRLDESQAKTIHKLVTRCMREGGILLVQPEYLLSFQLMELECHADQRSGVAQRMVEIRQFFHEYSTDVVDEIDENLSVKFELVYTVGQQRPIDHSPDRWRVIQEVLGLVFRFFTEAKVEFSQYLDTTGQHPGRVPRVRILRRGVEATIFERVATFICETGMDGFPISHQPPAVRDAVFQYITRLDLPNVEVETVKNSSFWHESTESHLLLLRGLFASGVLAFAFVQKHDEALFTIFNLLVRSDDADQEYQDWVKTTTMPHAFRHLQGGNLRDYTQLISADMKGTALNSHYLLTMVTGISSRIRVILDVDAQIVDRTNLEFCKEWLKCYNGDNHTRAVVFFDDSDNIMVLNRSGKVEELQGSPFADQLDQCLVFLDEAHTRGTDLRLPTNYRAAVTLGANLTKDRLAQTCMRMRKLGKGQSVEFCIPREIEQKIIRLTGRARTAPCSLTVSDVLCWAISETCQSLRREVPLWLTQGKAYASITNSWY